MISESKTNKIKRLINSILYGIEVSFIMILEDGYRLIAIQKNHVLIDQTYKTERGAKIAFTKFTSNDKMTETIEIKPAWSAAYSPDHNWITPILDICLNEEKVALPVGMH